MSLISCGRCGRPGLCCVCDAPYRKLFVEVTPAPPPRPRFGALDLTGLRALYAEMYRR